MAVKIKAKTVGINDLLKNINVLQDAVVTSVTAGVAAVSVDVANYAKENHPFANRTGNLEASIHPLPVEQSGDVITGTVKAGMEYAAFVEFGTARSAPYPYMQPALEANRDNAIETLAKATDRAKQSLKVTK